MHQGTIVFFFFFDYSFKKAKFNLKVAIGEGTMPNKTKTLIYLVDDDASVRKSMEMLLIASGMRVETFERAEDLLKCELREEETCLIADVRMPGMSGLELHQKLIERGFKMPVIFITGFDTADTRRQASKSGAFGYFRKPVDDQALLDSIQLALSSQWQEHGLKVK
jgi:FixJ family two-component response regulator